MNTAWATYSKWVHKKSVKKNRENDKANMVKC